MDEKLLPFTVCSSPFYDEASSLADMILPDATYLERWDWEDHASANQVAEFYFRQPLVEPLGEVRDLSDVFCDIAKRIDMPLGFDSKKEFVEKSCEKTAVIKAAGGFDYMKAKGVWHDKKAKPKFHAYKKTLGDDKIKAKGVILDKTTGVYWNWTKTKAKSEAEAMKKGYSHTKDGYKGYVGQSIDGTAYAGFTPDKINKSGYLELYSELMEEKGLDPMPSYIRAPELEAMSSDQLVLTTYKVSVQSHSRTQNCKWLTEIYHDNPAWINPETAAQRGVSEGDRIKVESPIGQIETIARVTPAVVPGTIAIANHCGHWEYGRYASGKKAPFGEHNKDDEHIWWKSNGEHPNWIIANAPDPISGQLRFMDTVVTVSKA